MMTGASNCSLPSHSIALLGFADLWSPVDQAGLPPGVLVVADRRELCLGIHKTVALHHRELVFAGHRNRVDWANLRAESAEHAPTGLQDELAELAISFLRGHDVHLEARRRANACTEPTGHTECLSGFRVDSQRRKAAEARRHIPLLFRILDRDLRSEKPLEGDRESLDFIEHACGAP